MTKKIATAIAAALVCCVIMAQGHSPVPGVAQPVTASAGAEVAYTLPSGTTFVIIHPRLAVYLKTAAGGAEFEISSGAYLTISGGGMGNKVLYFESVSGSGFVDIYVGN